jgi:hypothetical protein
MGIVKLTTIDGLGESVRVEQFPDHRHQNISTIQQYQRGL